MRRSRVARSVRDAGHAAADVDQIALGIDALEHGMLSKAEQARARAHGTRERSEREANEFSVSKAEPGFPSLFISIDKNEGHSPRCESS